MEDSGEEGVEEEEAMGLCINKRSDRAGRLLVELVRAKAGVWWWW